MFVLETCRRVVPATELVPYRERRESPVAARRRRALELAKARTQKPADLTTVTFLHPGYTIVWVEGQKDSIVVRDALQHTCCDLPDDAGNIYPVCGMPAWECVEYDWRKR